MNKIYVNKGKALEIQNGVVMGFHDPKTIKFHIIDKMTFEETLDLINTVQLELLEVFFASGAAKLTTDEDKLKLRRNIYMRASFGFGLMIDRFDPQAKDQRFEGKTDMEVLRDLDKQIPRSPKKRIPEV